MDNENKKILEKKGKEIFEEIDNIFKKYNLKKFINRIDFEEELNEISDSRMCPPGTRPVAQIDPRTGEIKYVCIPTGD